MEDYIRRASEIQIAIMCKYLYTMHKNTQAVIDFFRYNAKILNVPNVEYLEQVVINYKKIMPTIEELVVLSDLSYSRSKYLKTPIIKEYIGKNNFYNVLKDCEKAENMLKPKCTILTTNVCVEFISKYKALINAFDDFIITKYPKYD